MQLLTTRQWDYLEPSLPSFIAEHGATWYGTFLQSAWGMVLYPLSNLCAPGLLTGRAAQEAETPLALCSAAQQQLKLAWALPTTHMNKSHVANPGCNSCISASRSGEQTIEGYSGLGPPGGGWCICINLESIQLHDGAGQGAGHWYHCPRVWSCCAVWSQPRAAYTWLLVISGCCWTGRPALSCSFIQQLCCLLFLQAIVSSSMLDSQKPLLATSS